MANFTHLGINKGAFQNERLAITQTTDTTDTVTGKTYEFSISQSTHSGPGSKKDALLALEQIKKYLIDSKWPLST